MKSTQLGLDDNKPVDIRGLVFVATSINTTSRRPSFSPPFKYTSIISLAGKKMAAMWKKEFHEPDFLSSAIG